MYDIMTPGPTQVRKNVLAARSLACTNPALDPEFFTFYKETCELISSASSYSKSNADSRRRRDSRSRSRLRFSDRAGRSRTRTGQRRFGKGFADFVRLYGGYSVLYTTDYLHTLDPAALAAFLKKDHDFNICHRRSLDTPSGVLNDISRICPLLKSYGILTVVDSVSAMFGEEILADEFLYRHFCAGGSQKVISAPPGLTLVTISSDAWSAMLTRRTPVASFYASLPVFHGYFENQWFPYTMPISDIYGLRAAMENILADPSILERHARLAKAVRFALTDCGLTLHTRDGYSNTVTVFDIPEKTDAAAILEALKKYHNIMLAGSFDILEGQVIRIGHMGENAREEKLLSLMKALDDVLSRLGVPLTSSLADAFLRSLHADSAS